MAKFCVTIQGKLTSKSLKRTNSGENAKGFYQLFYSEELRTLVL